MNFKVFETSNQLNKYLSDLWFDIAQKSIELYGNFNCALSGGKTPLPFYSHLSTFDLPKIWKNTHFFQIDERIISDESENNNFYNINKFFFKKINIPKSNIHKINTEVPELHIAENYEKELIKHGFNKTSFFNIAILGLGSDGHTASLFPNSKVLSEKTKLASYVPLQQLQNYKNTEFNRITLTYKIINNSENIFFIVTGKDKSDIIYKIKKDVNKKFPASNISSKKGNTIFLLDALAASKL